MLYLPGFVGNAEFLFGGPGSMIENRNGPAKAQARAGARVRDDRGEGDHRQDVSDEFHAPRSQSVYPRLIILIHGYL